MEDVNEALLEMIESSKVQAIKHCSQMEQMFLQAVSVKVTRTGIEEACFKSIYNQLCSICSFEGLYFKLLVTLQKIYLYILFL